MCKKELTLDKFAWRNKKANVKARECKECHKVIRSKYYGKNSGREISGVKNRKAIIKAWFNDYRSKLKCKVCGESHIACLDFHHRDPKTKISGISDAVLNKGWCKARILAEIEKCDVLCRNCHAKEHYKPQ